MAAAAAAGGDEGPRLFNNANFLHLQKAKDIAKLYEGHAEKFAIFIREFQGQDVARTPRWERRKYMQRLQNIANKQSRIIQIDLDDLDVWSDGQEGIEKNELSEACERYTLRYTEFFQQACLELLPAPEPEFAQAKDQWLVQDYVHEWRREQEDNAQKRGEDFKYDRSMLTNFTVVVKPRSKTIIKPLRKLSSHNIGGLVKIEAMVTKVTPVRPRMHTLTYHCAECNQEIYLPIEGEQYKPIDFCDSARCKENSKKSVLIPVMRTSKVEKYQEFKIQEPQHQVPQGNVPISRTVICKGELVRQVLPGDYITVTGVYVPYKKRGFEAMAAGTLCQMYIEAYDILKHKQGYADQENADVEARVKYESEHSNIYDRVSKSIAPEIHGMLDVKRAMLLVLVGGVTTNRRDGMRLRGDIHMLLMGDPGVAKSQLLKQLNTIAPRSVYTQGRGSSGVGLTASIIRDKQTGEVTLEGGALVMADNGICCIDEFDKMEESDRTAIHEVMEQQTVSIAKAGITTTLNARCAVLAAANPKNGRYNPYLSAVKNMDLPASLLSRFDLQFLLLDKADAEYDRSLATHISEVHRLQDSHQRELDFEPFDAAFIRSYVRRARTFEPYVDEQLQSQIVNHYCDMRQREKNVPMDERREYTTPRSLLGLLRMSQALARLRFSDVVVEGDFKEALRLLEACKQSILDETELEQNAEKQKDRLLSIFNKAFEAREGWSKLEFIEEKAMRWGFTREQIEDVIRQHVDVIGIWEVSDDKSRIRIAEAASGTAMAS